METLEKEDMIPFEEAIKKDADSILIGHLRIKNIRKPINSLITALILTADMVRILRLWLLVMGQ